MLRQSWRPLMTLQRPSSVGIRSVKYLIAVWSAEGLLGYHAGHYDHKIYVPVKLLNWTLSSLIALQWPSSVGIRPIKYLIERFVSPSFTRIPVPRRALWAHNMRTGHFVVVEKELTHSTAAPQLGWNSTCKIFDWIFRQPKVYSYTTQLQYYEHKHAYRSIRCSRGGRQS